MENNTPIQNNTNFIEILDSQAYLIVKFFNADKLKNIDIKIKAFLFLLLITLFNPFNVINILHYELPMQISFSFILIWIYWGINLINKHHYHVYKKFWLNLYDIIGNKAIEANQKIHKKSKIVSIFIIVSWISLLILSIVASVDKLSFMGIKGIHDYKLILLCIQTGFTAYLTGLGFALSFKMLFTIYFLTRNKKYNIPFDPLNDDELGNYSVIENYSFKTTKYMLSGLLFIPFLTILANSSGLSKNESGILIISLIIIFSISLLISLLYPLINGYNMSKESKNVIIIDIRKEQYKLIDEYINKPEQEYKDKIDMLDFKMKAIEEVAIFPFKWRIWLKIVTMILLPTLSYIFQTIISEINLFDLIKTVILK